MLQTPAPPPFPPVPPFDPNLVFLNDGLSPQVVIIVAITLLAATVILWPVMRALARRLEGRHADPALRAEVDQLQQRLEEMDALQVRVAELEERIDFTERVLVQGKDAQSVAGRLGPS